MRPYRATRCGTRGSAERRRIFRFDRREAPRSAPRPDPNPEHPLIRLQNIRYSIGAPSLFSDITWTVAPGDRVALVGPNGAGKTTLIRIILGEYTPESGQRIMSKGTRLGYLPQEA